MADKMSEVYNAYNITVHQSKKGRGAILLKTDAGFFSLKTIEVNEGRLKAEYEFKEQLYLAGFEKIDRCVKNGEEELATFDRYNNPYVLRYCFEGRECDLKKRDEVLMAVQNLADLHKACRQVFLQTEGDVHARISGDFRKRNQEMKRVRNFILKKKGKKEFEELYIKNYDYFYQQAMACNGYREEDFVSHENIHLGYCHGMYNQHSILMCEDMGNVFIATVGFDRFYVGNQLDDLYHLMRKTVEKNDYDFSILEDILEEYSKHIKLDKNDLEYLYRLFSYPEKFYKISNQYMNSAKNWIAPKLMEKLTTVLADEDKKQELLRKFKDRI